MALHEIDNEYSILLNWRVDSHQPPKTSLSMIKHPHTTHELEKHEENAERNVEWDLNTAQDLNTQKKMIKNS